MWPSNNFSELILKIINTTKIDLKIFLCGSNNEFMVAQSICGEFNTKSAEYRRKTKFK